MLVFSTLSSIYINCHATIQSLVPNLINEINMGTEEIVKSEQFPWSTASSGEESELSNVKSYLHLAEQHPFKASASFMK